MPKVSLKIQNTGTDIEVSQIPIYIGLLDNSTSINSLVAYKGQISNVHTEYITSWKANEIKTIKFKFSSDQIQSNSYFLYVRIEELFKVNTTINEQINQIKDFPINETSKVQIIKDLEGQKNTNSDIIEYHEGIELAKIYIGKAIKVNSFGNTLGLILAIIGIVLAGLAIQ